MKTKNTSPHSRTSKLIASHALVAAIFTAPWIIFAYNDLFTIFINRDATRDQEALLSNLNVSLSALSLVALLVAISAYGYYFLKKSKNY